MVFNYTFVSSLIMLTFPFCCYGQWPPLFQDNITCGDVVHGTTTENDTIHYYRFLSGLNHSIYLEANTCNTVTNFETLIILYDSNGKFLLPNNKDYSCSYGSVRLTYGPLLVNEEYIIRIGGWYGAYGNYSVQIWCFHNTCMPI